jgi:hypothetical protein
VAAPGPAARAYAVIVADPRSRTPLTGMIPAWSRGPRRGSAARPVAASSPVEVAVHRSVEASRTVSRMSEQRRQDPANTQMFRAFVEQNPQEPEKSSKNVLIGVAVAVAVVVIAAIVVILAM